MNNQKIIIRTIAWSIVTSVFIWPAWGATIYVSPPGNDGNSGLTWATAKQTVQAGLNTAEAGDQVWVAAGTYIENITLKAGVALYGGLAGNEDPGTFNLANRDFQTNPTILDGSQSGSVVKSPQGATSTTRIDGFTIRNGKAKYGGGINCSNSSPTIANNTITENSASTFGGGIYCTNSSPTIAGNAIANNNSTSRGGGIYCYQSSPTITGNTMTGNSNASSVFSQGGGIYCEESPSTIANNKITANQSANSGGGIYCFLSASMITNNTITENRASASGGGICDVDSSSTIANNTISGNNAYGEGGGVNCLSTSITIINNTITANQASAGGGINYSSSGNVRHPTFINNIVAYNSSGISRYGGDTPTLRHNCVYGNMSYNYLGIGNPTGTNGNISQDPQLAGATSEAAWHIQPDSPCVDAGDDGAIQPDWLDIDGQPRRMGNHVDIGADESDGTVWPKEIHSKVIMVSPAGNDANNGASWDVAKRTVQAGIDAAVGLGAEVWVREGNYLERINLAPGIRIYGGFAGTELHRYERNWRTHVTILDGQQGGSVVTAMNGNPTSARIDGFTIRNGAAPFGGGVRCANSTLTIANNIMASNQASEDGGAIYCDQSTSTIVNNALSGNLTPNGRGAGIFCTGSTMTIVNNTIAFNTAASSGGGICSIDSTTTMANTIVASNSSGIHNAGSGNPTLSYNCVYGNAGGNYSGLDDPTGTNGNISQDPRLVSGSLWLDSGSPCIDSGNDTMVPADTDDLDGDGNTTEPIPLDLAVYSRFIDDPATPNTGMGMVDIGAYEYESNRITLVSAASYKTHGSFGTFGINLPLEPALGTGVECRKGGPTTVVLTFSDPPKTASVWASAGTVIDVTVDQRQATVQLGGAPSASCVVLTISTTPGLQGDNDVYIGCLYGDATGDGKTNVQDLLATKNRVSGYVNATTFRSDVDWDGKINVLDMTYIKNNLNQTVICP